MSQYIYRYIKHVLHKQWDKLSDLHFKAIYKAKYVVYSSRHNGEKEQHFLCRKITRNVFKKDKRRRIKKRRKYNTRLSILVYKSYTDYGNLKMNIVK